MCGINGFNWENKDLINKMNECIKHRGPDQSGIFICDDLSIGHTRLMILDLSEKGNQPMTNEDETLWIVYNGETYNFQILKEELEKKGHIFNSRTDTEVILHFFAEEGTESFSKLNGIFAFCIYDKNNKCIFVVRDRLGIKPLYYYYDTKRFIFSSEIKTFKIFNEISFSINENAVLEYFLTMNISDESFFKNIKSIEPGHYLKFDLKNNRLSIHKYFDIYNTVSKEKYLTNRNKNEKELIDELDLLLNKVVKDQLMADVPVGTICSGGIDSSLLTAIAKKYCKNLKIFNVSVEGKEYNESKYAKKVAQYLGLYLIEEELNQKSFIEHYKKCIALADLPLIHPNSVGIYLICKKAKEENIKVLLSGEGADELFGGYPQYKLFYLRSLMNKIPLYPSLLNKLKIFLVDKNFSSYLIEGDLITDRYKTLPWVINRYETNRNFYKNLDFINKTFEREIISYMLKDLKYYLIPILMRTDRMSMGTGLEMRVPYLDYQVVNFAVNIPLKYKVGAFKTKYLLKKVAERYLPKDIIYRKKMGFSLPTEDWLNDKDVRKNMFFEWEKIYDIDYNLFFYH
jgi:asparagine synthase (glutamine-hydrolysing)